MDASITHIRPRFSFTIPFSNAETLDRISTLLATKKHSIDGYIADHHIVLNIPHTESHYWSPQLSFRIEPDEDDISKTQIRGLVGPRPAVWTMFVFIYFSVGTIGFFIFLFGMSRWMLGEYSNLVLALPLAILFMLTAYRTGKHGEKLGAEQTETLKQFVRDALDL